MEQLTALRIFRRVVDDGSFAGAARSLSLSPAAISKNVGELEAHLGVRLLNRTTRRMSLTEPGRLYYEQVARILDDLAEADGSMQPLRHRPSGLLRVAAPISLTVTRLSRSITAFMQTYPEVEIDLHLDDRRVDLVKDGFDIAIRGTPKLEDSSLVARRLMSMRHVICGAPGYFDKAGRPRHPEELASHRIVQFSLSGNATEWVLERAGERVTMPVASRYRVSTSLAVREALLDGYGLSLIPAPYVREEIASGRLETVLDDWVTADTQVYAVYPSRRYLLPKVRALIDHLAEDLQSEA